jgi:spermidine synthase
MSARVSAATSSRLWLFATAFLTGAVVMALEILGSRLLAPVFGNSLFVWGALIGVILAAMSSGYALGGWLADRYHGGRVLAVVLLGTGAWTFMLAWVGQPVMFRVASWIQDPRWGPCLAATVLLAPPAMGLSGTLPALLRLSIADMGHLGRHTGQMIAVSTIGSLVGTWGTAFYLLTWLGSTALVAILGITQTALGVFWWWRAIAARVPLAVPVAGGLGVLAWLAVHPIQVLPAPVHQEDSPYQQVRVRDDDLFRYLILDRTFHAIMWKVDPVELYLPYSQMMMAALAVAPQPQRGLILGHGGGSLAKWLARYWPDLELDVVELDPAVVKAAAEFFGYSPHLNHHVHVKDARAFLRTTDADYDVIWVDVFARHLIPFHLTTQEFFTELRSRLDKGGVLAINLSSTGEQDDRQRAMAVLTTLRAVFPLIEGYAVKGPWQGRSKAENLIFFAGSEVPVMQAPTFSDRVRELVSARRLPVQLPSLLTTRIALEGAPGLVLTDDYAPFDVLMGKETAAALQNPPESLKTP